MQPSPRGGAAVVADAATGGLLLFGGSALVGGGASASGTETAAPSAELWSWSPGACARNCSGRGACALGGCVCARGWYGVDCSNATCPGSACAVDATTRIASCRHCCSAPVYVPPPHALEGGLSPAAVAAAASDAAALLALWSNPWGSPWASAVARAAAPWADAGGLQRGECSPARRGASRGTCDGFGGCQCVPPFTGADCAVMDCPGGCSGNGICVLEFPVGRCDCAPGFGGRDCAQRLCPGNCSWPRGECDAATGVCACATAAGAEVGGAQMFAGADCSVAMVTAGARGEGRREMVWVVMGAVAALVGAAVGW